MRPSLAASGTLLTDNAADSLKSKITEFLSVACNI